MRDIEFLSNPEAGELLIGSGSAFAEGFVLAVISRLSQPYPGVAYHVMPYTLAMLYSQLRERRIEVAFSGDSRSSPDDIDVQVLFEAQWLAVAASADNPSVRRRRLELADLRGRVLDVVAAGNRRRHVGRRSFPRQLVLLAPPRASLVIDAINVGIRLASTRGFLIRGASLHVVAAYPARTVAAGAGRTAHHPQANGSFDCQTRTLSPLAHLFENAIQCARELANPLHTVPDRPGVRFVRPPTGRTRTNELPYNERGAEPR